MDVQEHIGKKSPKRIRTRCTEPLLHGHQVALQVRHLALVLLVSIDRSGVFDFLLNTSTAYLEMVVFGLIDFIRRGKGYTTTMTAMTMPTKL